MSNGGGSTTTNALGVFTATGLNNRTYSTVDIAPPANYAGGVFAAEELTSVVVNGATSIGTIILQPGAVISGTITSQTGTGAVGGNMNVYDSAGTKRFTPNDAIGVGGAYSIIVPLGYNLVRAVPVVGSGLVPKDWELLDVTGPLTLNGTLLRGFAITGVVVDATSGVPLAGAKIKTFDQASGDIIGQLTNATNAFGQFSLLLPFGVSDWEVYPAVSTTHMPKQVIGVVTTRPLNIGQVRLERAVVLSGTVVGPGGPLQGVDIDIITANGHKLWTPRDNTNASGVFSLPLVPGTYTVTAQPQVSTGLAGVRLAPVTLTTALNLGTITASPGVSFSGALIGPIGPVVGGDIDVVDPVTGQRLVIAGGHTDAAGSFSTIVPAGTYTVNAQGPQGGLAAPTSTPGVVIAGPLVQNFNMPSKSVVLDVTSFFTWTMPQGGSLPIQFTFQNVSPSSQSLFLDIVVQYPSGAETPVLPGFPIDLPPMPFPLALGPIYLPIPLIPAAELGKPIRYLMRFRDRATNALVDSAYATFVAQ